MSAPFTVPTLAADTNARKYILEVDTNFRTGAENFQPMGGVKNFTFNPDNANLADDTRFSDGGYSRQNKTGTGWDATATVSRAPQDADLTQYDVVQEYVRNVAEGNLGSAAEVSIRWFEWNDDDPTKGPRKQAYKGVAVVAYSEPNGGATDNSDGTFAFTGQGKLSKPSHPYPGTPAVPVITSADPLTFAAAGGEPIHIYGQGFAGTTAVTVKGVALAWFSIESDSEIIGSTGVMTAGTGPVVVTNATGPSTTGPTVTVS